MFRIIVDSLTTGIVTEKRPFDRRPPFGFPVIDVARCTACEECARVCPTGAIFTATPAPGQRTLGLTYARCIQCQECVAACPEHAVSAGNDVEVGSQPIERGRRIVRPPAHVTGRAAAVATRREGMNVSHGNAC